MKEITIAYIGGGSMNFGWRLMGELASEEQLSGIVRLYDADKSLALVNEAVGNRMREDADCKSGLIYLAVDTLDEALRGADFVIASINQGSLDEMVSDIHLPEMYGVYQAVGESTGPGGISRAIRTIPFYFELGEKIKKLCPEAWVINLTRPMGITLSALYHVFPEIKAFGSSSEPLYTGDLMADLLSQRENRSISRREIKGNLIGIPDFAWYTAMTWQGEDLFPLFRSYAEQLVDTGYEKRSGEYRTNPAASAQMIKFDMFLRYGAIAAEGDRYVAEHCPPWYLKSPKTVSAWKFSQTSVNYLKRRRSEKTARSKKLLSGEDKLKIGFSGTEVPAQIKALLGLSNLITNGDIKNSGQATNLPLGAVVETNLLFSKNSVQPVLAGALPDELCALTLRHVYNQQAVLKAAVERDLDIAYNAFVNDPLVTTDLNSSAELYKEMLSRIRAHLVYYC